MNKICLLLVGLCAMDTLTAMQRNREEATRDLFAAIEGNRVDAIKPLVRDGADLEALSYVDFTPLQHAATDGRAEIVELLLEAGAKCEACTDGITPLHLAALKGHTKVLEVLLRHGANPYARLRGDAVLHGATVFYTVVSSGNVEAVALVLSHRRKEPSQGNSNDTSLFASLYSGIESVQLWLERCLYPKAQVIRGYTSLHCAAKMGHAALTRLLLAAGENKDAATTNGTTPLFLAAAGGHAEVVKLLVHANANTEASLAQGLQKGITPLHVAAHLGHVAVVKLLFEAGANGNAQSIEGVTCLHGAAFKGNEDIVRLFLEQGVDPNKRIHPVPAYNSLLSAVENGNRAAVQVLLEGGAYVNVRVQRGLTQGATSLHLAASKGDLEMCKLILRFLKIPVPLLLEIMACGDVNLVASCSQKNWREEAARCILLHNQPLLDLVYESLKATDPLKAYFAPHEREKNIAPLISEGLLNKQHVRNNVHWVEDQLVPFVPVA